MSIFITGFGFVGSNAAKRFVEEGHKVAAFDIVGGASSSLAMDVEDANKIRLIQGDVTNFQFLEEAIRKEKPQVIVHTSVFPTGSQCPEIHRLFQVNVGGTVNVLETARIHDLRVVYLSSGTIYGQLEGTEPVGEEEPFGPAYPLREHDQPQSAAYCISKRVSEQWVGLYRSMYGLETVSLRLGLVYGIPVLGRANLGRKLNQSYSVMLRKALAGQDMRLSYGADTFGNFVYVKDVADAIFRAATVKSYSNYVFNVAYERGYSMRDLAKVIMRLVPASKIELGPGVWPCKGVPTPRGALGYVNNRHTDISRAKKELGYGPIYALEDGFREYADWMRKNWELCSPEVVPFPV